MRRGYLWAGSAGLLAYAAAYSLLNFLLPSESLALLVVGDVGVVLLEIVVVLLCWFAYHRGRGTGVRWVWALVGGWVLGGLVGDWIWTYYEVVLGAEVPLPARPT